MKSLMKLLIVISIVLIFFSAYAIENQTPQWKGTIEEEDGVKVIKNPNEPLYGEITFDLEEDLSIGNEEDENYMFYRAILGEVDLDGNIFIIDAGNFRIQKYNKDGKYIQSIGRQGQGPGEFERPSSLYLDSENNIYVEDSGQKVHIFNKEGEFKNAITLTEYGRPITRGLGITKEGNLIAQTLSRGERKSDIPMDSEMVFNIELISQEGTTIKTVASFPWLRSKGIKTERGFTWPNSLSSPQLCLCPIDEDLAIYGYSIDYSLFAVNSLGEMVYIIKKDEPPQPITKAEKEKVIERFLGTRKENKQMPQISRSKYESALVFPKHKPFYKTIMKDDKDRIYVEKFSFSFDRSDSTYFDIFSKDGYYLYKAKIPIRYPQVIKNGCAYSTENDIETGYAKIKRYKIKNWEQIKD
jgi:hypothetical protein